MAAPEYRLCLKISTPKIVTYGEAFEITYTAKNIGNDPFPGGRISVELSWPAYNEKVYQPVIINHILPPNTENEPTQNSQAPLVPGYTWFYIGNVIAVDGGRVLVFGENGGQLWPYLEVAPNQFMKQPLHAVRARTKEEISAVRALWIAAVSLVILIIFQLINWVLQYFPMRISNTAIILPTLISSGSILGFLSFKKNFPDSKAFLEKDLSMNVKMRSLKQRPINIF